MVKKEDDDTREASNRSYDTEVEYVCGNEVLSSYESSSLTIEF